MSRTLALVAFVIAGVLGVGGFVAYAQSAQSVQRTVGGPRSTLPVVTPPPLPLGDLTHAQGLRRSMQVPSAADPVSVLSRLLGRSRRSGAHVALRAYTGPRPAIPKLTDMLKHRVRTPHAASGASIVLTGTSAVPYLDDQTLSYNANVYWMCQNLKPNTAYEYDVFSPDGYAYTVYPENINYADNGVNSGAPSYTPLPIDYQASFTTDASGRCLFHPTNQFTDPRNGAKRADQDFASNFLDIPWYANLTLSTPLGASPDTIVAVGPSRGGPAGSDSPYSGVWAIAMKNLASGQFDAVAYSVVLGTLNFSTYSNATFTTKANDFPSGSTVYVSASGLNPAHFYSFGFVNTGGNGLPCVFAIPPGSQNNNNNTCFIAGATGIVPTNGTLTGQWTTPAAGPNSVGTYSVELFDATTNDLISTQQISLNPSAVTWSPLVPLNGGTAGTNLGDIFATDGIINTSSSGVPTAEQSVTGLLYQAGGVTSGHKYQITVSNANGVILNSNTTDTNPRYGSAQALATPTPFTAASTSTGPQRVDFPINTATSALTAFGATQIPFAPNVYTAQLYDLTAATVLGSKSFQIISYAGQYQWTNPAGAYVNANAASIPTLVTTTLRNNAGTLFGSWNADSIKAFTIINDAGGLVTLGRQVTTTATDSVGQTWNITQPSGTTIAVTPAIAGQSLPPGATIAVPITVAVATNNCPTACVLRTTITPLHGIAPSSTDPQMQNHASNGLNVLGNGFAGANSLPSYGWQVGAYSNVAQLGTPRYPQMMYRSGTNGATGGKYTLSITVNNTGEVKPLENIQFTMPATVDPNQLVPGITSVTVNGADQTANWRVHTQSPTGGSTADNRLGNNDFSLVTTTLGAAIPAGKSATFVITLPILLSAFPFQEIAATGNYYQSVTGGGSPTVSAFQIGPTNTLTNAIAGTTSIDSTELGVFSLDASLMSATVSPTVIPALAGASTTFKFLNTSTGLDPNPDYISSLLITVPTGAIPSSVSVTSPNQTGVTWNANPTGTAGQWRIELCSPNTGAAPCSPATVDANSLPPGDELDILFNYAAAPSIGSYPIAWSATGANGGAVVVAKVADQPVLTVANTTAQTSFTFAGGYTVNNVYPPTVPGPITQVPTGSQAVIGTWADFVNGNGFVYNLHNNGSTSITDVSIDIPAANTSGQEFDTQDWQVITAGVNAPYVYGQGAQGAKCSAHGYASVTQPVSPNPGPAKNGSIVLSGCNLLPGQDMQVFFYALSPESANDINTTFKFNASVALNGTPPAAPNTLPVPGNSLSNTVRIRADARLEITVPNAGNVIAPIYGGGSSAATGCAPTPCTYSNLTNLINFGTITGTVTATDVLDAAVYTNDINGWSLSVSADVNPSTSSGQVSTWISPATSSHPGSGAYAQFVTSAPGTVIPTSTPLNLATFSGATPRTPVDNLMNYRVTVNPAAVNNNTTTTVTLTYTLVAN